MSPGLRRQYWVSRKEKLDRAFGFYDCLPILQTELKAHYARYLVILTSGFLEKSLVVILTDYSAQKSAPKVGSYATARLEELQNMRMKKIEKLIDEFDPNWLVELKRNTDFDQMSASIESIISNRNRVAHGEDISTTFGQIQAYYKSTIQLLDCLSDMCDRDLR